MSVDLLPFVSSSSGLVTAPQAMTNATRATTPKLIPQEPVAIPWQFQCFCGQWASRNHPLPYTQGQLIILTGVCYNSPLFQRTCIG